MSQQKACFVIAPIGSDDSDTRKRSDQILKHVVGPAVEEAGYEAIRADKISEPGLITSQVIQHVVDDPLVVADLTGRNPNVFYELAIRHAIREPLVQLIKKGEDIPFDVAGTRTVQVDHHDLDSVEEARTEILKQIRSVEADASQIETPISVALDLQMLRQSEKPEERSLADIVAALADMRSGISALEKRLDDPSSVLPQDYLRHVVNRSIRHLDPRAFAEVRHLVDRARRLLKRGIEGTPDDLGHIDMTMAEIEHLLARLARYNE